MKGRMVLTIGVALVISLGIPLLGFPGIRPPDRNLEGGLGTQRKRS